jgi:hypothetical protein
VGTDRPPIKDDKRVISFRPGKLTNRGLPRAKSRRSGFRYNDSPAADLKEYESSEPDDYRHRMIMNFATMGIAIVLIVMSVWFASVIAHS